jgi:alkyl hydroperoxide reductase subunit AhpC
MLFVQPDAPVKYPILADPDRKITVALNMMDPDEKDANGRPLASRALHIIGPDCRVSSPLFALTKPKFICQEFSRMLPGASRS